MEVAQAAPEFGAHVEGEQSALLASVGMAGNIEVVPLVALHIDNSYQRDLSRDLVEEIKNNWDAAAAGPIVVSRRQNGDLYIINGQHRAAAAAEAGRTEIVAQVINGLSREAEAELRLMGNTRRTDTSQERFRARVAAGHKESLEIVRIVAEFDTRINPTPDTKGGINSVAAVEKLYRVDRGMLLTRTLEVVQDAFGAVGGRTATVAILNGVAWTLAKHPDEIDRRRLVERIQAEGVDSLERKARNYRAAMGGPLWTNVYRSIVETYNHRLGDTGKLEVRTGGWSTRGLQGNYGD